MLSTLRLGSRRALLCKEDGRRHPLLGTNPTTTRGPPLHNIGPMQGNEHHHFQVQATNKQRRHIFRVADFGISPDPVRTKAIRYFPTPQNIHDLRSYHGLANTLSNFLPNLVQSTAAMRKLICTGNAYTWLEEHNKEFLESKRILTGTNIVKPFHPNWPT